MLLPNKGVNLLFKQSSSLINIFHFDFNNPNHFLSLSDNSEIVEFLVVPEEEKFIEIEKFHLKRPDNDLLKQNGHVVKHLKHDHYHKITQVLQFENFLILGYDDGLILVYQITKKQFVVIEKQIEKEAEEEKNNENKKNEEEEEKEEKEEEEHEENNENEENEESEENKKLNIKQKEENNKSQIQDNNEQKENDKHKLDYFNSFSLYYILLGHIEEILSLCYIPELKILISSSIDHTIKIFDFTTGQMTHFFKFDFIINRILYQNITKKGEPKIVLTLLSQSPIKVIINLSTNPIMCNTHYFEHIDIDQLEKINDKYYGMNSKNIKIFDKNLELEGNLVCLNPINLIYFYKYKNDFLIVDNENMVRIVTFNIKSKNKKIEDKKNDKNKKKNPKKEEPEEEEEKTFESVINSEYKFKVGEDNINGFFHWDKFILAFSRDGNLYLINYEKIQESCETAQMIIEDEESLKMMGNLVHNKKNKKGKKDKGKKDKKKK